MHIDSAKNGNTTSMVRVAESIRNCVSIHSNSWSEFKQTDFYQSGSFPAELEAAYARTFDELGPDCTYVNSQIPSNQRDHFTWSNYWYYQAANRGDPIAKLELSLQRPVESPDRPVIAKLLNDAQSTDDYRVYYYASQLYAYVDHDERNLTGRMWQYVGCSKHPLCSPEGLQSELEAEFVPADVDLILAAAARIHDERLVVDFLEEPTVFDLVER